MVIEGIGIKVAVAFPSSSDASEEVAWSSSTGTCVGVDKPGYGFTCVGNGVLVELKLLDGLGVMVGGIEVAVTPG